MPDFPIAFAWQSWYRQHPEQSDCVGVLITPLDQWKDREQEMKNTLHQLFNEGKPALLWAMTMFPSSTTPTTSSR